MKIEFQLVPIVREVARRVPFMRITRGCALCGFERPLQYGHIAVSEFQVCYNCAAECNRIAEAEACQPGEVIEGPHR